MTIGSLSESVDGDMKDIWVSVENVFVTVTGMDIKVNDRDLHA